MTSAALNDLSIAQTGAMLRAGEITSVQLTQASLERIGALDSRLNAFITLTADRALAEACEADAAFARGDDYGPLQGVPYALKDIYDTAGLRTTCHSKLRMDHVPVKNCAVQDRLRAQGAVLLGKLATFEFALGGPSFDLPFPPARNPWNIDHSPGGSSSGSAAAVSAGYMRLAMGSCTGGSIRGPAALCGIVGMKPTFGLISRRGAFPLAWSLDHAGPLTFSVEDAAIALEALAGHDPRDPGSADVAQPDFRGSLHAGVKGLRIGVPRHFFAEAAGVSNEVIAGIDRALEALRDLGAHVEEVRLPDYDDFSACGRVIMFSEGFSIHEQDFRERPLDFAASTYQRMVMGAFVTGADLIAAHRLRRELVHKANAVLARCDALVTACALDAAPAFGGRDNWSKPSDSPNQTMPWNVTGHPAMSVPTGLNSAGLPMSLQIVGKHFDEPMVLRIGAALEKALMQLNGGLLRPPLA
jgi:aspartyl-tRNA(Asn)/glutamyl-tRNA(Gln) amidotransferase subunit A